LLNAAIHCYQWIILLLLYKFSLRCGKILLAQKFKHNGGKFVTSNYRQTTLGETFADCHNAFLDNSPTFFELLQKHIDLTEFIPASFHYAFYLWNAASSEQ